MNIFGCSFNLCLTQMNLLGPYQTAQLGFPGVKDSWSTLFCPSPPVASENEMDFFCNSDDSEARKYECPTHRSCEVSSNALFYD